MIVDIISYYCLGALITWIFGWIAIFPKSVKKAREYAIATNNERMLQGLRPLFNIIGTLAGTFIFWWVIAPRGIINADKLSEDFYYEMIKTGEKRK